MLSLLRCERRRLLRDDQLFVKKGRPAGTCRLSLPVRRSERDRGQNSEKVRPLRAHDVARRPATEPRAMLRPSCWYGNHKPVSAHASAAGVARSYDDTGGLRRTKRWAATQRGPIHLAASQGSRSSLPAALVAARMLCLPLALLHEASLRGAGQRPAVAAHGFGHAGVALAFLQEARFGRTRQGFASLLTALLSQVSCAEATAKFRDSTRAASRIRFMSLSFLGSPRRDIARRSHASAALRLASSAPHFNQIKSAQPLSCLLHSL